MNTTDTKSSYTITSGNGGLPKLELIAADGARAQVYLHGAHVTAWAPAGGLERLFLSKGSQFSPGAPIRGGIPVVFPQFGANGPLPMHGLARLMPWEFSGVQEPGGQITATFRLQDTEESRRLWAHAFLAELAVSIGGSQLQVSLGVKNTGSEAFEFTTAFHTYFSVAAADTLITGLEGLRYRDNAAGGALLMDEAGQVSFAGEVNRMYLDAPSEVRMVEPDRTTRIRQSGFTDNVLWNPGPAKCAAMPDLEPEDYLRFVCVEAVTIGAPVRLLPGEHWAGTQQILA